MANILALRQNFIFWLLILKEDQKIIVSNVTVTVTFCPSEKDTIAAWKKYHFLNINPSNMIVLKFHMFLVYIILSSNSFKTMFLSGWK